MQTKTEHPTPKRLRDARKKGQVAKSREIGSAAAITAAFCVLWAGYDTFLEQAKEMVLLPPRFYELTFTEALKRTLDGTLQAFISLSLPILGAVFGLLVLSHFIQVGGLFTMAPIKPNLAKINPVDGFKRLFSIDNFVELLKSTGKVLILTLMFGLVIKESVNPLMLAPRFGLSGLTAVLNDALKQLTACTIAAFLTVALLDYFFQRSRHIKKLTMTREEVRREYREMEGDPILKGRRRELHRELAMADTLEKVRKATVLITNPTRRAIALFYDPEKTRLPVVTAKGEDFLAKRMIEVARKEGIPIMENIPLARDLFEQGHLDQYIPTALIQPVVEVLRWVKKIKKEESGT